MSREPLSALPLSLNLERAARTPQHVQLYEQLRALILTARLPAGTRLPSTRTLAAELGVSRTTVLQAFDQLRSEGYVEGHRGAGTFVPSVLPDALLVTRARQGEPKRDAARPPPLSRFATGLDGERAGEAALLAPFHPGLPETGLIPFERWARLMARAWRRPGAELLSERQPGGHPGLRRAIARHLGQMRGLDCTAEQVIITSSAREAVDLVARALLDPGDQVWLEDPGFPALRHALAGSGAAPCGLPVDDEGLSVAAGLVAAAGARMAVVTPSRQYPLGVTMSLSRRLALLDWAQAAGAWIVEDDYDSEYRYAGRPLQALQSLDETGRVIYLGSFSKVLFQKLRLGYLVLPEALLETLLRVRQALGQEPSIAAQPVLAEFIDSGAFAAHIRRTRRLYAERQAALLAALAGHADGLLAAERQEGGMHLVARLGPALARRMTDTAAAARAAARGIAAPALSALYLETPPRQGLLLGYAGVPVPEMAPAMRRLVSALRA